MDKLKNLLTRKERLRRAARNLIKRCGLAVPTAIIGLMLTATGYAQNNDQLTGAKVFQAAGPTASSIQSSIEQFRNELGGLNNNNNAGPIGTGRREINWDGGGAATSVGPTPLDNFLANRGARFTTTGSGFVQAPPAGLADVFENPTYANIFKAFSPLRLFSPIGSNVTETLFFQPGPDALPATTRGFGAIFTDVDLPDGGGPSTSLGNRHASTLIEYLDAAGNVLFSSFVPASPGDGNFTFFGIVFSDARIARVRITAGAIPGPDDSRLTDVVMMDDFIYGEPQRIP
jgi:hypothetical protein